MYVTTKSLTGTTATLALESRTGLFTKIMGALRMGGLTGKEIERVVRPQLYTGLSKKLASIAAHYQLQTGMDPQAKLEQIAQLSAIVARATDTRVGQLVAKAAPLLGLPALANVVGQLNKEVSELTGPAARASGASPKNFESAVRQYTRKTTGGTLALPNGRQSAPRLPNSFNIKAYTTKIGRTKIRDIERMSNNKLKNFAFPTNARRSQNNINKAFREFSRKFHPNKAGGNALLRNRYSAQHMRVSALKSTL
jgi:hypothetical protein